MLSISIKKQYKDTVIGFNNSGISLGQRTKADLIDLAILAHESGDMMLADFFETLPPLTDLKKEKMRLLEKENKK